MKLSDAFQGDAFVPQGDTFGRKLTLLAHKMTLLAKRGEERVRCVNRSGFRTAQAEPSRGEVGMGLNLRFVGTTMTP